jgi:hypothetical protein
MVCLCFVAKCDKIEATAEAIFIIVVTINNDSGTAKIPSHLHYISNTTHAIATPF